MLYKLIRKFFFLLNLLLALYSLLIFQLSYSADIKHWLGGFLMLTVPVIFVVNLFFVFSYLSVKSWRFLLSLIILVVGYPLMERSFKLADKNNADIDNENAFSVATYNLMYCDYFNYKSGIDKANALGIAKVMDTLSTDVKCFQEFYNIKEAGPFGNILKLKEEYPFYTYMNSTGSNPNESGGLGLAVFSKYKIINKEEIAWKPNNNGVLRTDLLVHGDTISIFNIQLKSMGIRVSKLIAAPEEKRAEETKNILSLLKSGFQTRSLQVDKLIEMLEECPYPTIVCGDINELPYGYAYGKLLEKRRNAFQEKGKGFGFTYHKILDFLRIDNIFYDAEKFELKHFETLDNVDFSDHYPLTATFELKP